MPTPGPGPLLGEISYPLNAIHYPILQIAAFVLFRQLHMPGIAVAIIVVPTLCLLALPASRYFYVPLRAWLSRKYHVRQTAMPTTAP